MPFDFLRRRPKPSEEGSAPAGRAGAADGGQPRRPERKGRPVPFDGLTEEWRLSGMMWIDGRMSDALNKRESIEISDVTWAPIDRSASAEPAPGLKGVDPYDLIVVFAGPSTMPELSDEQRAAFKVRKVPFDIAIEAPPYRIVGTVHLHPGTEPERLLERASDMFVPVTEAVTLAGDREIDYEGDVVLVNRFYMRGVKQVDKRTGEPVKPLPGQPLGGTSWQDRSR